MFSFTRPTSTDVERALEGYSRLNLQAAVLDSRQGLRVSRLPAGFAHDHSRTAIGQGRKVFEAAISAFQEWKQFDLGWVRVANPAARIEIRQTIAVEIYALGLWSLNVSEIVDVTSVDVTSVDETSVDETSEDHAFGFIYKTSQHHAEEGEERFLLTFDPKTKAVHYDLEAISRPRHWLARLGYPAVRALQHKFARDSHKCIREAVSQAWREV
jgi:uncharacterized protein (UPF0548 family)